MAPLGLIAERHFLCIGKRVGPEHDAGAGCKATHNEGVPVGDGGLSWLPSLGTPLQDLDTALEENPSFVSFSEGDTRRTVPNTVPK